MRERSERTTDPLLVRAAGDRALLLEPADAGQLEALVEQLRVDLPDGVLDVLPAAATVLLTLAPGAPVGALRRRLAELDAGLSGPADPAGSTRDRTASAAPEHLEVPVVYDGEDLADVADLLGISPQGVVARHTAQPWRCAFVGFAPGFGYLTAPQARLAVPRRQQSRTSVPTGAVALADGYSAVYPRASPGGWQVVGRTDVALWDLDREQPALVQPGTVVTFVDVTGR